MSKNAKHEGLFAKIGVNTKEKEVSKAWPAGLSICAPCLEPRRTCGNMKETRISMKLKHSFLPNATLNRWETMRPATITRKKTTTRFNIPILNPCLCCGRSRVRVLHKSLHLSRYEFAYCTDRCTSHDTHYEGNEIAQHTNTKKEKTK